MTVKRKVGRPRKRKVPVRRRRQEGGQIGAIMPLLKFLGPLVLGEVAKFGISKALHGKKKKKRGRGLHVAGGGLRLAGQGHTRVQRRGRKPGPKRRPRNMILPFPPGFRFPVLAR